MTKELLKQALEALESDNPYIRQLAANAVRKAMEQPGQEPTPWRDMVVVSLVREGINKHKARELADHFAAQPVQEPVAYDYHTKYDRGCYKCRSQFCPGNCIYTTPPLPVQPPSVKVTDAEKAWRKHLGEANQLGWSCVSFDPKHMNKIVGELDRLRKALAQPPMPVQPERQPLTDEQVKELLLIAPVYAPNGVVTRTPFAYRKELLDTALWAFRKAEAAHGIEENT